MKSEFKFQPNDPIIWNGNKGLVVNTWWDGQENRCEIYLSAKNVRGSWSVTEASLKPDKSSTSTFS